MKLTVRYFAGYFLDCLFFAKPLCIEVIRNISPMIAIEEPLGDSVIYLLAWPK